MRIGTIIHKAKIVMPIVFLIWLTACADVQPWERGNLAKVVMAADPSPMHSAVLQHNLAYREAAGAAGVGVSGGGCGCE